MVEIKNKNIDIEKIQPNPNLDLSLFKKKGNSKTFKGWIIIQMNGARKAGNLEMAELLQFIYKKYLEFETSEKVVLKGWKGKSSMQIINSPDYFTVITFQKEDQDQKPHEVKRDITKLEVNRIIKVINELSALNGGKRISTRDIGEKAYKRKWDDIFADRFLHTNLNLILNILQYYKLTSYRGKYTTVIKEAREIQEVLDGK